MPEPIVLRAHACQRAEEDWGRLTWFAGRTARMGSEVEMGPGDVITSPPGFAHHATNVGDETAVLVVAFSSADRQTVGE